MAYRRTIGQADQGQAAAGTVIGGPSSGLLMW